MEHGTVLDEAYWNGRYNERERMWSGAPNAQLVKEVSDLTPGTALDVGCGEGGDAIWLAKRGWQVTGWDISSVALERAAEHAGDLAITWLHADFTKAPVDTYDLVTSHFMHLWTRAEREDLQLKTAAAVAPGGTLLIVGHHPSIMANGPHRPQFAEVYYTAEEIAALLPQDEWTLEVVENRQREDKHEVITDSVLKARRTQR
jgi:SAM-dependent methyltransferase